MAERNDPKPATRTGAGRPLASSFRPAEEDPLVELARIVSGGASFEQAVNSRRQLAAPQPAVPAPQPEPQALVAPVPAPPAAPRIAAAPKPAPAPQPFPRLAGRTPTASESSLASALEAELLGDLQASFAAARSPLEAPAAPEPAPGNGHEPDLHASDRAPDFHEPDFHEPDFDDFAHMNLRRSAAVLAGPAGAAPAAPVLPAAKAAPAVPPTSPPIDEHWDLPPLPPVRPRANGADQAAAAPPADARWGAPPVRGETRLPPATPFPPSPAADEAEDFFAFDAEGDDPFAEGERQTIEHHVEPLPGPDFHSGEPFAAAAAHEPLLHLTEHGPATAPELGGAEHADAYADDYPVHHLPPIEEDPGYRARPRGLIGVAAVLVLAIAGFGTVVAYRATTGGGAVEAAPPVIAADPSPTRRAPEPDDTRVAAVDPGKLIYERVDPTEEAASANLVTEDDPPVAAAPEQPLTPVDLASREISRIILPGAPGDDTADAGATAEGVVQDSPLVQPIGPRRVRTVVVGADGTIISSEAEPTGEEPAIELGPDDSEPDMAPPQQLAALGPLPGTPEPGGPVPRPNPARTPGAEVAAAAPAAAGPSPTPAAAEPLVETPAAGPLAADASVADIAAATADAVGLPAADEIPAAPQPPAAGPADPAGPLPSAQPAERVAAVAPPPQERPTPPAPRAAQSNDGPISLLPEAQPQPAPVQAASAGTGGFVVQVTAQRSEAQALDAYRDLQRRYPSLLGGREPLVQRADLGGRGIFYRVRVGPAASQAEANQLCGALKSAGADCIVARN